MHALAHTRGGKCLSSTYVNRKTKLLWECAKGHRWEAMPDTVVQGSWCPHCQNKHLTIGDMQRIASSRKGKCLSDRYITASTKLQWECAYGHRWEAVPSSVMHGSWCPYCRNRYLTIDDMQRDAIAREGKCLSDNYINASTKLRWECKLGHQWEATPNAIRCGHWCPRCAQPAWSIDDMRRIAAEHEGACLSNIYVNKETKMLWKCKEGHQWEATWGSIRDGRWCPECAGRRPVTIADMRRLANDRGGKCLSGTYVNDTTKLRWECQEGHQWDARPGSIKRGSWCPICAGKIPRTIDDMRQLAQGRGGKCLSTVFVNMKTKILWECGNGHQWETSPEHVFGGKWCPACANIPRHHIEELRGIAFAQGGQCLSPAYLGLEVKLRWGCADGHQWDAPPHQVLRGYWCPKCGRARAVEAQKYTPADMQAIAQAKGGTCLSPAYELFPVKMRWKCREGHVWEAPANTIRQGHWCPECGAKRPGMGAIQALAQSKGGNCLSPGYVDHESKLLWECTKGHRWEATVLDVRQGAWCPQCAERERREGWLRKMQEIAVKRGGKCLSPEYKSAKSKLLWECKEGHQWEAIPDLISRGAWCPKCARAAAGLKRRLTLSEMGDIATTRGGECLSGEYLGGKVKLRWRCNLGHEWEAVPSSIKAGRWCPKCVSLGKQRAQSQTPALVPNPLPFAPPPETGMECPACKHRTLVESTIVVREETEVVRRCLHCNFRERL